MIFNLYDRISEYFFNYSPEIDDYHEILIQTYVMEMQVTWSQIQKYFYMYKHTQEHVHVHELTHNQILESFYVQRKDTNNTKMFCIQYEQVRTNTHSRKFMHISLSTNTT